jgi:hypothetical protein
MEREINLKYNKYNELFQLNTHINTLTLKSV